MAIRAILFDLDGTLLDTLHDIASAANDVLQSLIFPIHPIDQYRVMVGDGVSMLFQRALPQDRLTPELLTKCMEEFEHFYARRWNETSAPYPGIPELLDRLIESQLPISVLSNKPHPFTCQCVQHLLAKWKFDAVLGQRPGFPRKPDPSGVFDLLKMIADERTRIAPMSTFDPLRPEEVLYVGDTNTDMHTAVAAGCHPIGVTWGFRSESELAASGAKTIVHHPLDLIACLGKEYPNIVPE